MAKRTRSAPSSQKTRRKRTNIRSEDIDYKNVNYLRRYISEKGKIRSRSITGASRRHQQEITLAIKRAREMALLPYVSD